MTAASTSQETSEKARAEIVHFTDLVRDRFEKLQVLLDPSDANILFYVTGALCRSELDQNHRCQECISLLLENGDRTDKLPILTSDGTISEEVRGFWDEVNRGGLLRPSSTAFGIGMKCWNFFTCIQGEKDLKAKFLSVKNQRLIFIEIVIALLQEDREFEEISDGKLVCNSGHQFGRSLVGRFANCFLKNLAKELTGAAGIAVGTERKTKKLTSSSMRSFVSVPCFPLSIACYLRKYT